MVISFLTLEVVRSAIRFFFCLVALASKKYASILLFLRSEERTRQLKMKTYSRRPCCASVPEGWNSIALPATRPPRKRDGGTQ